MGTTTQVRTFSDLFTDLLNRVREGTTSTPTVDQAKRYVNVGLQDMHIGYGERFPWAERKGRLTTQPPYQVGTVAIAKGSTTLVGTGTLWSTANTFGANNVRTTGHVVISGSTDIYDVAAVASDGSLTLASKFVSTDVTGASYIYFEDEYDLDPDFLRPLDAQFFDDQRSVRIIDRMRFRREYPRNSQTGKPIAACIVDRAFVANTIPVRRAQLFRVPDQAYSLPYSFVTNKLAVSSAGVAQESLVADADEPIVPFQYRHAIVMHALYNWYRDKKDDNRSSEVKSEFVDLILRISGDTEIGERRPVIQPSMGGYRRRSRQPYRHGSGNGYTTGDRFDRMESDY
jgi:hypothetical protein